MWEDLCLPFNAGLYSPTAHINRRVHCRGDSGCRHSSRCRLARVCSILWNRPACHRSFPPASTPSLVSPPLNTTSTPCLRSMHNRHPTHTSSCSGAKDTSTARVSVMWMNGRGRPAARRNKMCDGDRTWHRQKLVRWHLLYVCMLGWFGCHSSKRQEDPGNLTSWKREFVVMNFTHI
jgi:hypothetical protein